MQRGDVIQVLVSLALGAGTFSEDLTLAAAGCVVHTTRRTNFKSARFSQDLEPATTAQLEMFMRFLQQEFLIDQEMPSEDTGRFDTGSTED